MVRGFVFYVLLTLLVPMTADSAWAVGVKTREITFESGHVPFRYRVTAFIAEPEGKGPFPALIMVHEWFGLTDWMKDNAKRLAAKGYVVIVPDLYQGKVTDNLEEAKKQDGEVAFETAIQHLMNGVNTLIEQPNVDRDRLGIIGWGKGGFYALQLSRVDDRLKACVMCYGAPTTEPKRFRFSKAAILGIFAETDPHVRAATVKEFAARFKQAGKKIEGIHFLKGTGHGFMRPANGPDKKKNPDYNEAKAKEAWQLIDNFLAKHLGRK